jgi:hypothetical protein
MNRALLPVLFVLAACHESGAAPTLPPDPVLMAGSYAAVIAERTVVARLDGSMTVALVQRGDSLSGEYRLHANLSGSQGSADVVHTGHLVGVIIAHEEVSVRLRIDNTECPRYFMDFVGSYDDDSSTLTLTGAVDVINTIGGLCHLAVRFPSTLQFTRQPSL